MRVERAACAADTIIEKERASKTERAAQQQRTTKTKTTTTRRLQKETRGPQRAVGHRRQLSGELRANTPLA